MGCNLETNKLLDDVLIVVYAIIRSNTVFSRRNKKNIKVWLKKKKAPYLELCLLCAYAIFSYAETQIYLK